MERRSFLAGRGKSQLRRCLPFLFFVLLILPGGAPAFSERFFIMADRPYSEGEVAQVRVDLQRGAGEYYHEPDVAPPDLLGGVDVRVYRIADPVAFLEKQKDLHRPDVVANYRGDSALNGLRQVFSNVYQESRRAWQRIFSPVSRVTVAAKFPALKQAQPGSYRTDLRGEPKFAPLSGYEVLREFRYPVLKAKPVTPPTDVKLQGSSSEFIPVRAGDVYIPLGKLKPGLYLTEVSYNETAAYALVFVSDTILITKTSSQEMFVWSSDITTGVAKAGVKLTLHDGLTRLAEATTDTQGVARFLRPSLEKSFLFGMDDRGGVSISENFYYDSEIYGLKVYMHTDRPLYQPGDAVNVKIFGREFLDALQNRGPQADAEYEVKIVDPRGRVVFERTAVVAAGEVGGDFSFVLPDNTLPGGYTIRLTRGEDVYVAALRVRRYVKPIYEVTLASDKPNFSTGENVTGKIRLKYPNGKPIVGALVRVIANSQKYTMMSGRLAQDSGRKTLQLDKEFKTDAEGAVTYSLPPLDEPSRYIIQAMATDAAYAKVSVNKEVLVRNGDQPFTIVAASRFSAASESVTFTLQSLDAKPLDASSWKWQAIRSENQTQTEGKIDADGKFSITFAQGGAYSVRVLDSKGRTLASEAHWVSGTGIQVATQTIQIVADKEEYNRGDTAKLLIAFGEPVNEALLTLERDVIHAHAQLTGKADWITLSKINESQYRAEIPITEMQAPNISFSVLSVTKGQYFFNNKGIKVKLDPVEIRVTPPQEVFRPGENVMLDISTLWKGKAAPATLSLSVVDEMIYVLQPEIAPEMAAFFYHPRRNQVRTVASLDFHTYNISSPGKPKQDVASRDGVLYRPLKLRERPRREDRDTAAWFPKIITDAQGHATVSFTLPDSITRWRMTARALDGGGHVGQETFFIESRQDVYLKWLGESTFRSGDAPVLRLAVFNQTEEKITGEIEMLGAGLEYNKPLELLPGENAVSVPWNAVAAGEVTVSYRTGAEKKSADILKKKIRVQPALWTYARSEFRLLKQGINDVKPQGDFSDLSVRVVSAATDEVSRIAKQLIDYPFGCIEQVTSRLLPVATLLRSLSGLPATDDRVVGVRRLAEIGRARLIALAGSNYHYGWWGDSLGDDAFVTAYAHLALFATERALGLKPEENRHQAVLTAYEKTGSSLAIDGRAFAVWVASRLGLPAQNLAVGVAEAIRLEVQRLSFSAQTDVAGISGYDLMGSRYVHASGVLDAHSWQQIVVALMLLDASGAVDTKALTGVDVDEVATVVINRKMELDPFVVATAVLRQRFKNINPFGTTADATVASLLRRFSFDTPTVQRALAILFLTQQLELKSGAPLPTLQAGAEWSQQLLASGVSLYKLKPGQTPNPFQLAAPVAEGSPLMLALEYQSTQPPVQRQNVELTRQLFKLTREDTTGEYRATSVGEKEWKVTTDGVYLEVIRISTMEDLRFNVLDVPLPVGAEVEPTTWGMKIPISDIDKTHIDPVVEVEVKQQNGTGTDATVTTTTKSVVKKDYLNLRDTMIQERDLGYALPVTAESDWFLVKIVRFRDPGKFSVPSARLMQMYTGAIAFEKDFKDDGLRMVVVE